MRTSTRLTYVAAVLTLFGTGQIPFSGAQEESAGGADATVILAQETTGIVTEVIRTEAAKPAVPQTVEPLQIIGVLSASHMYTTYGYIGVTADALTKKVYRADQVGELMTEVSAMCDNIVEQLGKVNRKDLTEDDSRALDDMRGIYSQLKQEAEALKAYAGQQSEKNAAAYDDARKQVWPKIEKMLGLKPQKS